MLLRRSALTHDDERRPVGGVGLTRLTFVDHGQHRAAQGNDQ
jgi:hypothetical protein